MPEELWKVVGSALIMSICISIYQSIKKHSDKKNHIKETDYNDYEKDFFEELKRKNAEYDAEHKSQPTYCSQCGTKLENNAVLCHNCVNKVKE